jgi:formate-dependent nitrite reductase membrane component NrfD
MTLLNPAIDGRSPFERMLFRSRHIYLLGGAALNVLLGLYLVEREGALRTLQRLGGTLLLLSPLLALVGFAFDPGSATLDDAHWGKFAAYAVFGGTLLHLLSAVRWNTQRR